MLSFEFSVFDLVLSIAVVILIILFVTTLSKLNPSDEKDRSSSTRYEEIVDENPQPISYPSQPMRQNLPQPMEQNRPAIWQNENRASLQKPRPAPSIVVNATIDSLSEETQEQGSLLRKKSRELEGRTEPATDSTPHYRASNGKDCPHEFGYLKGLPKGTPIPEECFGCQRIVECLVNKKGR